MVKVLNRNNFSAYCQKNNINDSTVESNGDLFISICDTEGEYSKSHFNTEHQNVIILNFDDVSEDSKIPLFTKGEYINMKSFTTADANKIINFLNRQYTNSNNIIVHCNAGVARSGAVGEFCSDFIGQSFADFKKDNQMTKPNPDVRRILNNTYYDYRDI